MSATPPLTLAQVESRYPALLAATGDAIHTFSSGSEWDGWASGNCYECRYWDPDAAGQLCAFEAAAFLSMVTPALAQMFGWTQATTEYGPRSGWDPPAQCPFFRQRPEGEDGEGAPPPEPDPDQLVLIADPTEDIALFPATAEAPSLAGVTP